MVIRGEKKRARKKIVINTDLILILRSMYSNDGKWTSVRGPRPIIMNDPRFQSLQRT